MAAAVSASLMVTGCAERSSRQGGECRAPALGVSLTRVNHANTLGLTSSFIERK